MQEGTLLKWGGKFSTPFPEVPSRHSTAEGKPYTKFSSEIGRDARIKSDSIKVILDEIVVHGMQEHRCPQASGLETQPGKNKTRADRHDTEIQDSIPPRSTAVITGEQDKRHVPHSPDEPAYQRRSGKARDPI